MVALTLRGSFKVAAKEDILKACKVLSSQNAFSIPRNPSISEGSLQAPERSGICWTNFQYLIY